MFKDQTLSMASLGETGARAAVRRSLSSFKIRPAYRFSEGRPNSIFCEPGKHDPCFSLRGMPPAARAAGAVGLSGLSFLCSELSYPHYARYPLLPILTFFPSSLFLTRAAKFSNCQFLFLYSIFRKQDSTALPRALRGAATIAVCT